jgi:hypothetical protein
MPIKHNLLVVRPYTIILLCLIFLAPVAWRGEALMAQSATNIDGKILLSRQWSAYATMQTSGFGIGYRNGKYIDGYRLLYYDVSFEGWHHPKEIRSTNPFFPAARGYKYGKLNYIYVPRVSIGLQKLLNDEPYWGGVEVSSFYKAGLSLSVTKPVYLVILKYVSDPYSYVKAEERYDPDVHYPEFIYGNGNYFKGFNELGFFPGIHAKAGLNFEYSSYREEVRAVEVGLSLDAYPRAVPVMAFNKANYFMLSMFINYQIGARSY